MPIRISQATNNLVTSNVFSTMALSDVLLSFFPNVTEPERVRQVDVVVAVRDLVFMANISFKLDVR